VLIIITPLLALVPAFVSPCNCSTAFTHTPSITVCVCPLRLPWRLAGSCVRSSMLR
jgi:hypothetical protein